MGNNVKFYSENYINANSTFSFTSAESSLATRLYDNTRTPTLISQTSDDSTPEVFEITFDDIRAIDTIFIDNHNIKSGAIKYWDGATYQDFSTPIAWTNNAATTNIFSFTLVSTNKIQLTMNTAIVANAQKYVGELRAMTLLCELTDNPSSVPELAFYKKQVLNETATGGNVQTIFGKKFKCTLGFDNANNTDITLLETLSDRASSFYIHLCGSVITYTERGFRLQDMYYVNMTNDFKPQLRSNILGIGNNIELDFWEI